MISGYFKTNKEGVTRSTVVEGEIVIRDKEKQKELEDTGKTQKLANINRDLDKAQEVTKDEVTEFGVYISDTSIRTLVKTIEVVGIAVVATVKELENALFLLL